LPIISTKLSIQTLLKVLLILSKQEQVMAVLPTTFLLISWNSKTRNTSNSITRSSKSVLSYVPKLRSYCQTVILYCLRN